MVGKCFPVLVLILLPFLSSCGPIPDYRGFASGDVTPPVFVDITPVSPSSLRIAFDGPVRVSEGGLSLKPDLGTVSVSADGSTVLVEHETEQEAGMKYCLQGVVQDEKGNAMSFITDFYGFNPRIPSLIINEFTTQGSSTHPDMVEFAVQSDGNTAGMVFFQGVKEEHDALYLFPPLEVRSGDFVILHCKPQGIAAEVDESDSKAASGGYDASADAWDLWFSGGKGLSGNNGVISLYENPGGKVLDAVLYSNRTSESDTDYGGFGSTAVLLQAQRLAELSAWEYTAASIRPEDAVNPTGSTATRSLCRGSDRADTNSSSDWHIVPTSCFSFGSNNSDEVYEP